MNKGYFKLHRRFFDHWLWSEQRCLSKAEAWIDLLQIAAYVPTKRIIRDKLLQIAEGELIASLRYLADKWGWNKDKAASFLRLLESEGMIRRESRQGESVIILCRYKDYAMLRDTGTDTHIDKVQTEARQQADKDKERKESKPKNPLPPATHSDESEDSTSKPLCTLAQAICHGPVQGMSEAETTHWWHSRNCAGWTKSSAGGGHARKITSWQSDMAASVGWVREQMAKNSATDKSKPWKPNL